MAAITKPITVKSPGRISKRIEKELHQTKVVIRRLPPDFTEEKLSERISPFPDHNYYYFTPGDPTAGVLGCSRAYIGFANEEDILPFHTQYDGTIFESEKGTKYRAVIEFGPYQGVPKKTKRKPDARCGTVEQDPDYQAFLTSLEAKPEPLSSVDLLTYREEQASKVPESQTTPLIEYLKEKRGSRSRGRGRGGAVEVRKKQKGGGESSSKAKGPSSKSEKEYSRSTKSRDTRGKQDSRSQAEMKRHSERSGSATSSATANHTGGSEVSTATAPLGGGTDSRGAVKERRVHHEKEDKGGGVPNGDVREKRERGRGRRNRDRPDRAIYVPRNQSSEQLSGSPSGGRSSTPKEYSRSREGGDGESYGRSKQGDRSNHRYYDRDKNDHQQQHRDRGGGGREREHGSYSDTREFKKKPRDRYGGGGRGREGEYQGGGRGSRGSGGGGGERKKYSDSEFRDR